MNTVIENEHGCNGVSFNDICYDHGMRPHSPSEEPQRDVKRERRLTVFLSDIADTPLSSTVRPERRGATCIRVTVQWSHEANLTMSPLVAHTTASTVQDRCPGLPVSKWPGTVVLDRWLLTCLRRPFASTPFVWLCDLRHPTYSDHLQRPVFCRCWPTTVELFANRTKTVWQSSTV